MLRQVQRYKLLIEYRGTKYGGWQKQRKGIVTVQGVLENGASLLCRGGGISSRSVSRTDKGVHALGNVVVLSIPPTQGREHIPPHTATTVHNALNYYFLTHNEDIRVLGCESVTNDWYLQEGNRVAGKQYVYRIFNNFDRMLIPCWENDTHWSIRNELDIDAMKQVCTLFEGQHDFTTFQNSKCTANTAVRTITECQLHMETAPFTLSARKGGQLLNISVKGSGFVYNQVRNMVGSIVAVGLGKATKQDVETSLLMRNRANMIGTIAPPCGLFLKQIYWK